MKNKVTPALWIILLVALAYLIGAFSGYLFSLDKQSVSLAWPAAGIALAAVLRYGKVAAIGILLAILAEKLLVSGMPVAYALAMALSGAGAALFAAWGMNKYGAFNNELRSLRDVRTLLAWGVLITPVLAAIAGMTALSMIHIAQWEGFESSIGYRAMGDALGVLLFTPLVLGFTTREGWLAVWDSSYHIWLTVIAAACVLVFSDVGHALLGFHIPPLVLFPLIVWGAYAYALSALSLGLIVVFIVAFASHLIGTGYYAHLFNQMPLEPWLMVSTLAASALGISAANAQQIAAASLAGCDKLQAWLSDSDKPLDRKLKPLCENASEQILHAACAIVNEQTLHPYLAERDTERALLRSLIDANPDLIFVKDIQGRYLLCNRALEEYVEKLERDILGKTDIDLFGHQIGATYREQDMRVLEANTSIHTEDWVLYNGGRRVLLDTLKSPLRNAQGDILGVVGICRDITQHRELEQTFVAVMENHQRSVGQDLHDNLGQRLVAITYLAKALEQKLFAMDGALAKNASTIVDHAQETVAECKQLAQGLVPVELEAKGLLAALHALASRTTATFGIVCEFDCTDAVRIHDTASALNLYRIAQEATNNAIRHGKATYIRISLSMQEHGARLAVHDNGKGFSGRGNASIAASGMGMKIMRYRASLIGASLQFITLPQGGAAVTVDIGYRTQMVSHGVDRRKNRRPK